MSRQAAALLVVVGASAASLWERHAGLDCSNGPGVVALRTSTGSLQECQRSCASTPGCDAVVREVENVTWATHEATNCWQGHGATDLADGFGTADDCPTMELEECRDQCLLIENCTGLVYAADGSGACCLRADVVLSRCDADAGWATHTLDGRAPSSSRCSLLGNVSVAHCDARSEAFDTYLKGRSAAWWRTTHFAERVFMPRHFSCNGSATKGDPTATCTLRQLQKLLPETRAGAASDLLAAPPR